MGTNCGKDFPPPDTINQCAIDFNQQTNIPNFCTFAGPAGDGYRSEYCSLMSDAGEWGDPQPFDNFCNYADCMPFLQVTPGCCRACCGIIGESVRCRRQHFRGDPVTCCFNDMNCTNPDASTNPPQCYSDAKKQKACDNGTENGNYRTLTGTGCQDVMMQYCTGTLSTDDPNSTAWLDRWTQNGGQNGSCTYALIRNLYRTSVPCLGTVPLPTPGICNQPPIFPVDAEGYFWGQRLVSAAMAKYKEQGFEIGTLPGFPGYNPWQDFLYSEICCPTPGLCQDGLDTVCSDKTSQRISLNPAVAQWCGCHLPQGEYEDYSVKFNIPPECTPMCNRVGTIPITGINADPINCRQNICLIDDVTVNIINSTIGNGLDFNQVCANCGDTQCSCIVSNTTIDISNSTIGGNVIPINEGCGSFTCSQTNPGITGPRVINVPCGTTGSFNPYAEYEAEVAAAQANAKKNAWLWTLIAIGIALVLIYFIILIIHPSDTSRYKTT